MAVLRYGVKRASIWSLASCYISSFSPVLALGKKWRKADLAKKFSLPSKVVFGGMNDNLIEFK